MKDSSTVQSRDAEGHFTKGRTVAVALGGSVLFGHPVTKRACVSLVIGIEKDESLNLAVFTEDRVEFWRGAPYAEKVSPGKWSKNHEAW